MNVFYNKEGIGDTLLVSINDVPKLDLDFEKKGDVTRIFNTNNGVTSGFNLFHISSHIAIEGNGNIELTEELFTKINQVIRENGFEEMLEADFTPKFVIGYIEEKEKHPNADKLSICKVNVGTEVLQIVCGAPNVDAGQKVVVAKVGAVMPSGLVIKDAELRGVASSGMICSAKELDLPNAPQEKGILVLSGDQEVGKPFVK